MEMQRAIVTVSRTYRVSQCDLLIVHLPPPFPPPLDHSTPNLFVLSSASY